MALFPDYIHRRFAGHDEGRIARVAGVSVDAITLGSLGLLAYAPQVRKDGIVSVARYRWRIPYVSLDPWTPVWQELVGAGLATPRGAGWGLTKHGLGLCERIHREARRYLESIEVAPAPLSRLMSPITSLADLIPAGAERATYAHRGLPLQNEINSDIVRLDRAISELWNFRDDAHISAWQAAGFQGPTLDVLSQVWEGEATFEQIAFDLVDKQNPADLQKGLDQLIATGDIRQVAGAFTLTGQGRARRESIERETDSRYFRRWSSELDLAQIGIDLTALITVLPEVPT